MYKNAVMYPYGLPCSKFVSPILVKRDLHCQSIRKFTSHHEDINEILKKKGPKVTLKGILKPEIQSAYMKCVFLEGMPGMGKSTIVWELCRNWDEIEELQKYSLIIFIRLQDKSTQKARSVSDLCSHKNVELNQAIAANIEAGEGKDVLFILDGFDELPFSLRKKSIFVELVKGTYLSQCTVLVTSRPSATADFLSVAWPHIHKRIEVVGFTKENIKEYAESFFTSKSEVLEKFLMYTSTNIAVRSMMHMPLYSRMVIEVYIQNRTCNGPLPQTTTQLYIEISRTLLKRYLSCNDQLISESTVSFLSSVWTQIRRGWYLMGKSLPEWLSDLPLEQYQAFLSLTKLAFEGMERNEVIFDNLPNYFIHFGFMNVVTELYMGMKASVSHSFLHLTFQEFLAAFHISQLPPDDQKYVFENCYTRSDWDVIWRFVAGLTGFSEISNAWEIIQTVGRKGSEECDILVGRHGQKEVFPFLTHCLYEAQKRVNCDDVLRESEVAFCGVMDLTEFDCYTVGYCAANSKCGWSLNMCANTSLGNTLVEMLKHGLSCKNPPYSSKYANIRLLNICGCGLTQIGFEVLADIITLVNNLNELCISDNPAGDGGLVKLFSALSQSKCLRTLYMVNTNFGRSDLEALSPLVSPASSLKNIRIGQSSMSHACSKLVCEIVISPSSLENVRLWGVTWTEQAVSLLEENKNITRLQQRNYKNAKSLVAIAKAMQKNTCVKELELNTVVSPICDDTILSWTEMLKRNCALQTLKFNYPFNSSQSIISPKQLLTLSSALQYNCKLKELKVKHLPYLTNLELDPRITEL